MNVICHEAVCIEMTTEFLFYLRKVHPIIAVIIIRNENRFPVMSTMDDVVGVVRYDQASDSRHAELHIITLIH